jgi:hypothetical protein
LYLYGRRAATKGASSTSPHFFTIVREPSLLASTPLSASDKTFLLLSERKIDQIEARLGSIEGLLKNLSSAQSLPTSAHVETPGTGGSGATTAASTADYDSDDDESAFGGDSALTAHTVFASDFLEKAVNRTTLQEVNPNMRAALTNLSQLVAMHKHKSVSHGPRFPLQKPIPAGGISMLPMPPLNVVVSLLKQTKGMFSSLPFPSPFEPKRGNACDKIKKAYEINRFSRASNPLQFHDGSRWPQRLLCDLPSCVFSHRRLHTCPICHSQFGLVQLIHGSLCDNGRPSAQRGVSLLWAALPSQRRHQPSHLALVSVSKNRKRAGFESWGEQTVIPCSFSAWVISGSSSNAIS